MDFNPANFIFLHPRICNENNIENNDDAVNYWNTNSNLFNNYENNLNFIPQTLSPLNYIINENKSSNIDVSSLNSNIKTCMINVAGYTIDELASIGEYIPYIHQKVRYDGDGIFSLQDQQNYSFSASNLIIGDDVRLTFGRKSMHARVLNVDDATFSVNSNDIPSYIPQNDILVLEGTRIYDPYRLSAISYYNKNSNSSSSIFIGTDFNPTLYKLLYPESSYLNDYTAYTDFIVNEDRIGSVYDIGTHSGGNVQNTSSSPIITVSDHLDINDNAYIKWGDINITYVTNDELRPLSSLNYANGFITEYAIKNYIDKLLKPTLQTSNIENSASLTSSNITTDNLIINNFDDFSASNLTNFVKKGSIANGEGTIFIDNAIELSGGIAFTGNINSSVQQYGTASLSNIIGSNITVQNTLYVGNDAQIDGELYESENMHIKGRINSYGGIYFGPVDFTTYNTYIGKQKLIASIPENDYNIHLDKITVNDISTHNFVGDIVNCDVSTHNMSFSKNQYIDFNSNIIDTLSTTSENLQCDLHPMEYEYMIPILLNKLYAFDTFDSDIHIEIHEIQNIDAQVGDRLVLVDNTSCIINDISSDDKYIIEKPESIYDNQTKIYIKSYFKVNRPMINVNNLLLNIVTQLKCLSQDVKNMKNCKKLP